MKLSGVILASLALSIASSPIARGSNFFDQYTLSPVQSVLEVILSPFIGSMAATALSQQGAVSRRELIRAVARDAADFLDGAPKSALLEEVISRVRAEQRLRESSQAEARSELSDSEIAQEILLELVGG